MSVQIQGNSSYMRYRMEPIATNAVAQNNPPASADRILTVVYNTLKTKFDAKSKNDITSCAEATCFTPLRWGLNK